MNNNQAQSTESHEEQLFWADYFRSEGAARKSNAPIQRRDTENITRFNYNLAPWSGPGPSPLVDLDVGLLRQVFTFAIREDDDIDLVEARYPTKLIQICRGWRAVALGIPTLWSSINVAIDNPSSRHRVRLWLIRTGLSCGLSLGLGYDISPELREDVMRQYLPYRHRWHAVFFYFPPTGLRSLQLLTQDPRIEVPQLTAVILECKDCPIEIQRDAWTIFASSGNLRTVAFQGPAPYFIPPVPWNQLYRLSIMVVDIPSILSVLVHCKCLKDLEISPIIRGGLTPPASPIILPSLRRLALYTGTDSAPLLDCFAAPCLLDLCISQEGHFQSRPSSLHSFLARSQCSLGTLEFADCGLVEDDYLKYIESPLLARVKSAKFSGNLSDKVVTALTLSNDNGAGRLFPELQSLSLRGVKLSKMGLIEEMIISRAGGKSLKSVVVFVKDNKVSGVFATNTAARFNVEVAIVSMDPY